MKIQFNTNVKVDPAAIDRKKLVGEISIILNKPTKYLGMPTANYEVGEYTITKSGELLHSGALVNADNSDLLAQLAERGMLGEVIDRTGETTPDEPEYTDANGEAFDPETLGFSQSEQAHEDWENCAEDFRDIDELPPQKTEAWYVKPDNLLIEMPMDGFSPEKLDNLVKLVTAKETLLKTALGVDDLPIQMTADTIKFPWFAFNTDHERVSAYTMLIAKICAAAKTKHRVLAKERDTTDNPKYAFRCWLLSLGFIGDEYKAARKTLLANLGGDGSWKSGKKTAVEA